MKRIERIKSMEQKFDNICFAIKNFETSKDDFLAVQSDVQEISDYYFSPLWMSDFEADEQGTLPKDLKRGILSEDGIYNMLSDNDRLLEELQNKTHISDSKEVCSMKKLLYIDSCIRDENSRTKRIALPIVEKLKERYEVETIILNDLNLPVIQKEENTRRGNGIIGEDAINWACKIRDADRIVIAAPFWDMSIPAALKTFFELCSLLDITFKTNNVTCYGNCRCEDLLFITTRGMNIKTGDELEQATSYIKALSWLWGIKGLKVIARENFDYISADKIEEEIKSAIEEGLKLAETF